MGKVLIRLVDQTGDEKFFLERPCNDIPRAQQLVLEYVGKSVRGLRTRLNGGGLVELEADADQLSPDMVKTIREAVEVAMRHFGDLSRR